MSGIERRVDKLGRVVLPIRYRERLGLKENSKVNIHLSDDSIFITPAEEKCIMCGSKEKIHSELCLCSRCIEKVKTKA
jgi:transcriptional pleiotropic regulator of transition state genes